MSLSDVVDSIAGFLSSVKKFIQKIGKKFGIGFVSGPIQDAISVSVIAVSLSFLSFVIYFILNMYVAFSNFLAYVNNIDNGGTWASCFVYMLNTTGISAGIQMAMPFYLGILVFYFTYGLYQIVTRVLKTFSDETFKSSESFK